jgi:predicted MPP superfamily phosphohydrolase
MKRLAFALSLVIFFYLYLGFRLAPGIGWPIWLGFGILVCGTFIYVFKLTRRHSSAVEHESRIDLLVRWLLYLDLGFLSIVFGFAVFRDLLLLPFLWFGSSFATSAFSASGTFVLIALAFLGLMIGVYVARTGPHIREVKVGIRDLPDSLEGYRIVQISDLHIGPSIGAVYVERVVEIANSLQGDMVALTGDIADGDISKLRIAASVLGKLQPAGQIFYVPGNHEYYWNAPGWLEEFERLGMQTLLNARKIFEVRGQKILVAGVMDPAARMINPKFGPDVVAARGDLLDDAAVRILLAHQPGVARAAAAAGFDLQLSGHTHAGQFFPWTLVVYGVHEFVQGLKACGKMWVYVNPGTGSWGPPIRFGTKPEITSLILVRAW